MFKTRMLTGSFVVSLLTLGIACNKQGSNPPPPKAEHAKPATPTHSTDQPKAPAHSDGAAGTAHPGGDPHAGMMATPPAQPAGATLEGSALSLEGITMTVPEGWKQATIAPGPFAPVAVFEIAKVGDDPENGQVRITHYPNMKGMDDNNINRWLGQVSKADGSPYTREEVEVGVSENGNVRVKMIDLSGQVKATMRDAPHANSRMIAAIVDHPKGPHFIVASGGSTTIGAAADAIKGFINSASVE